MTTLTTKTITAENTFTDAVQLEGYFNLSLSGTITSATTTVTVQRSVSGTTGWLDVDTFDSITETFGFEPEFMYYRVGCKTGQFTTGDSVVVRIGREDKDRF